MADKQLAKEILFDMRQADGARAATRAAEATLDSLDDNAAKLLRTGDAPSGSGPPGSAMAPADRSGGGSAGRRRRSGMLMVS